MKIMIVEDDRIQATSLKLKLRQLGLMTSSWLKTDLLP